MTDTIQQEQTTFLYYNRKEGKMHKIQVNEQGLGVVTLPIRKIEYQDESTSLWDELEIDDLNASFT